MRVDNRYRHELRKSADWCNSKQHRNRNKNQL